MSDTLKNTAAPPKSTTEVDKEAFVDMVQAIAQDMPLIMHGSGDVDPSVVNSDALTLLSELTANYIANLVDAAVDAHDLLNDGRAQPLPPRPLAKSRQTPLPAVPPTPVFDNNSKNNKGKNNNRKRRRTADEFWDEPLKEPKIKIQSDSTKNQHKSDPSSTVPEEHKFKGVPIDQWVGLSGVDFFESHRARKAHVTAPSAIGTRCFIFPVCHDVGLYGKVLEVQAARRSIAPLLADPIIQDVVRTEGTSHGPGGLRKRDNKKRAANNNDDDEQEPEETDSEGEDGGGAAWPGLEALLPVHQRLMGDFMMGIGNK